MQARFVRLPGRPMRETGLPFGPPRCPRNPGKLFFTDIISRQVRRFKEFRAEGTGCKRGLVGKRVFV